MKSKMVNDNIFSEGVVSRRNFVKERISQLTEFSKHFSTFFHRVAHKLSRTHQCSNKAHLNRKTK